MLMRTCELEVSVRFHLCGGVGVWKAMRRDESYTTDETETEIESCIDQHTLSGKPK